jgi:tetratricopeptide (TPR) repeat protein
MTTSDPKALSGQATRSYQDGDFAQAAQLFEQAAQAYLDAGNALDAAEMRNNQSVALLQENNPQGAYEAALGTDAVFAEAGDIRRQGMALGNQAAALEELKRIDEAIPLYQSAAELLAQAGEDQMRALIMQSLATIYIKRGKFYDGLFAMNDGLRNIKNPTLKQKVLRQILKLRTW